MSYKSRTVVAKEDWESMLGQFPEANFLQSWNWGVFQERMGKAVIRLVIEKQSGNEIQSDEISASGVIGMLQIVHEPAKRGPYLAVAGGPLLDWSTKSDMLAVISELKILAKQLGCWFVRIRPQEIVSDETLRLLRAAGLIFAPMHLTADLTLQLDLTKDEQVILSEMRKNTRGSIKKADREGVVTTISTDKSDMIQFCALQKELADAHGFVPFSDKFLQTQFDSFLEDNQVALIHAWHGEQLLATSFIIFYRHEAVYHYGVSSAANREFPGSAASQWRAIQEAKKRGCTTYNFWGIAPKDELDHRFAGVSLFKRGFGGEEIPYIPAHDLPVNTFYWVTYFFEKIRAKFRNLS